MGNGRPLPSNLANGMDALNLSNNPSNHPDVFNAAWQVFMNSVNVKGSSSGGGRGGPPGGAPTGPPPMRGWK